MPRPVHSRIHIRAPNNRPSQNHSGRFLADSSSAGCRFESCGEYVVKFWVFAVLLKFSRRPVVITGCEPFGGSLRTLVGVCCAALWAGRAPDFATLPTARSRPASVVWVSCPAAPSREIPSHSQQVVVGSLMQSSSNVYPQVQNEYAVEQTRGEHGGRGCPLRHRDVLARRCRCPARADHDGRTRGGAGRLGDSWDCGGTACRAELAKRASLWRQRHAKVQQLVLNSHGACERLLKPTGDLMPQDQKPVRPEPKSRCTPVVPIRLIHL